MLGFTYEFIKVNLIHTVGGNWGHGDAGRGRVVTNTNQQKTMQGEPAELTSSCLHCNPFSFGV